MSGKTSLFPRSTSMFHPVVRSKIDACCGVTLVIVSPGLSKVMWCFGLLPRSFFLSFSSQSDNTLRTASCLLLYLPCVSDVEQDERTCSSVPDLSHRLHFGSSVSPQRQMFAGDGKRPYTYLIMNDSLRSSYFQMSPQVSFLSVMFHVVHAPCDPISTALACLTCSSALLTSDWIMARLSVWSDLLHGNVLVAPMPWRPTAVIPTMSLCLRELSVNLTVSVADHFLPVRVTIPASWIRSSGESLNVSTSLVLAVLNSSTSKDSGSCSLLFFPYSPILVKLGVFLATSSGVCWWFSPELPLLNWVLHTALMAILLRAGCLSTGFTRKYIRIIS